MVCVSKCGHSKKLLADSTTQNPFTINVFRCFYYWEFTYLGEVLPGNYSGLLCKLPEGDFKSACWIIGGFFFYLSESSLVFEEIKHSMVAGGWCEVCSSVKILTATRVAMQLYHTSNPSRNAVATRTLKSDISNSTDAKLNSGVKPRRCCLPACLV